jgi:hypothetical protein
MRVPVFLLFAVLIVGLGGATVVAQDDLGETESIGGEPVIGDPVEGDQPIGGPPAMGEPMEEGLPIEGAPVEGMPVQESDEGPPED